MARPKEEEKRRKKQVRSEHNESCFLLVSQIINDKKHVLLCNKVIKAEFINKKHFNEVIKYGIISKLERTKETHVCDCETNREGNTSIVYDNEGKEKTSSTYDKEGKEAVNESNFLLNIYDCW